nr:uncharacterized protein LOC104646366 [Solanum lycopersicum]
MHTRFTTIINEIYSLGEVIPNGKAVIKHLSFLPESWESKVEAITEARDLDKIAMEKIIGNLILYELKINQEKEIGSKRKEKNLSLKTTTSKDFENENIALMDKSPDHFIKFCPLWALEYKKNNPEKAKEDRYIPNNLRRTNQEADISMKKVLAAIGGISEEESENEEIKNQSLLAIKQEDKYYFFVLVAVTEEANKEEQEEEDQNSQSCPYESHLKARKRILRYLKGSVNLVQWYQEGDSIGLIGRADADYARFLVEQKSTFGMSKYLGPFLVSWATRKQNFVALSTAEGEYVAAASCCAQLLWIKQQLEDFGIKTGYIPIMCDNTSAINMAKNSVHRKHTKHINILQNFLRDNVEKRI